MPFLSEADHSINTRIAGIWDHTLDASDLDNNMAAAPDGFSYGTYWSQAQIQGGYATCLSRDYDGHGTHVAGTAAGAGWAGGHDSNYTGIAPEATLYIVKFDFENEKSRNSETAILDGINWIFQKASAAGMPAVINMSLGSDYGPHDGSTAEERGIDDLTGPDNIVVVAAGNAGRVYSGPGFETFGAPIHGAGNTNTASDIVLEMAPDYTPTEDTDFIFWDIWYPASDTMRVQITTPSGKKYPGSFRGPNRNTWRTDGANGGFYTPEGTIFVANTSATANGWDTDNGDNNLYIELSDNTESELAKGRWVIELIPESGTGSYNAWHGTSESLKKTYLWYNSGTTDHNWGDTSSVWLSNNKMTIGKPASALSVISVGAYQTKNSWAAREYSDATDATSSFSEVTQAYGIAPLDYYAPFTLEDIAPFSSRGPSRDGRTQPSISAPGVGIIAALSQTVLNAPGDNYYRRLNRVEFSGFYGALQGTSMASPHVTGVTAILLEQAKSLGLAPTPEMIRDYIQSGARADNYTDVTPNNDWGFGKIDTVQALAKIQAPPLTITTAEMPNATQGTPYIESILATGGQAPYTWSISQGNLPAGLGLDTNSGLISGTPTSNQTEHFEVTVTDSASNFDTSILSIAIDSLTTEPLITGLSPDQALPGERAVVRLTGQNFQPGTTVSMGPQIIIKQVLFISETEIELNLSVKKRAVSDSVNVTVINPDGGSFTATGAFTIL
jgi:subtilisin family serine protease